MVGRRFFLFILTIIAGISINVNPPGVIILVMVLERVCAHILSFATTREARKSKIPRTPVQLNVAAMLLYA